MSLTARMAGAVSGLVGLLLVVGYVAVWLVGIPVWWPVAFAVACIGSKYLVAPRLVEWMVPARIVSLPAGGESHDRDDDDEGDDRDRRVAALVARRCRDAGVPPVKLGIVADGAPNAFAFGRSPRSARVWLTEGLIDRLDEDELDAVVCHELGHVKHWDMAVMTAVALVPMLLYLAFLMMRQSRNETQLAAWGAYGAYLASQLCVLGLGRARELSADRWSCECSGKGTALATALMKVAYGIGGQAEQQARRAAGAEPDGRSKAERRRDLRRGRRLEALQVMGMMSTRQGTQFLSLRTGADDPAEFVAGLRWELASPWAHVTEKLSTHPRVSTRIEMLARSGLPGAPTLWPELRQVAGAGRAAEVRAARQRFPGQALIALAPWACLVPAWISLVYLHRAHGIGWAVTAAGLLFLVKQRVRFPFGHQPVARITSLLDRLDAGPVAGIPVRLRGRVMGRESAGNRLSAGLVIADDSGFVPLHYDDPTRIGATRFALFRADELKGRTVVARGWYFRRPHPVVQLRDLELADVRFGETRLAARAPGWLVAHVGSAALLALGVLLVLAGIGR